MIINTRDEIHFTVKRQMAHLEVQTVNCWRVCIPPPLRAARKSALSPSVYHLDGSLHCLFNYMYIIGNYTRKQMSLQVIRSVLEYAYLVWLTKEYGDLLVILDTCLDKGDRWYTEIRTHTHRHHSGAVQNSLRILRRRIWAYETWNLMLNLCTDTLPNSAISTLFFDVA